MVYTVTMNPSLDYIMYIDKLNEGLVNRSVSERIVTGGKGINVSYVLSQLDIPSVILGFTAGFTGEYIKQEILQLGLTHELIDLKNGMSRINVKLKGSAETEINGQGPEIFPESVDILIERIKKLEKDDLLVLSGSVPATAGTDVYRRMARIAKENGVRVVVDATGQLLTDTLEYSPFMIKPNIHELSDIFKREIYTIEDVVFYSRELIKKGAQNVIVSMGDRGAVLVTEQEYVYREARKGKAVNTTGAGDSLVAGFIYSYLKDADINKAFGFAVETGTVAAFSEGLPQRVDLKKIKI
ncbi:MAG: 1-phosphofructokinase [Oscillospiraceae bacterium]|nr:1-phosphofructokinase [Oscillospiraceae bacterium]